MSKKLEHEIKLKRVYDPPAMGDGTRILVDRLWPRGLTKEKLKDVRIGRKGARNTKVRTHGQSPATGNKLTGWIGSASALMRPRRAG